MRRRTSRPDPLIGGELDVTIERLGARGDGIAAAGDGPIYVAGGAPGDRLRVSRTSRRGDGYAAIVVELLEVGPARRRPECKYYAECGGCVAQHVDTHTYEAWKERLVEDTLRRRGLPTDTLQPLQHCATADRRRAHLHARHMRRGVQLGFHAPSSNDIVDISECSVLRPTLVGLLPALRTMLRVVLVHGARVDLLVTETTNGTDLVVTGQIRRDQASLETLAAFAAGNNVARISRRERAGDPPEPLVQFEQPFVDIGDIPVALPAGAFLQASKAAEKKLAEFAATHVGAARRVADLYAGLGALTVPLVQGGRHVHAVDTAGDVLSAVAKAAGQAGLGGRLTTERRDLDVRPLQPNELKDFDAVVFDPPRAGAQTQARILAQTNIPRVVAISCEPGTFARDAAILSEGGYRLETILPIDQFVFSSKIELAASFCR